MIYRTLGRTGLKVSLAGLGTGGAARIGQSAGIPPEESQHLVRAALELGINTFDTSPSYGGSEELLGAALKGIARDRYVIATKFQPHEGNMLRKDPEALTVQLEQSLRRLGVETIDVLQYHGIAAHEYSETIERFHPVALRAKRAGKVRFIGITETVARDATHQMLVQALNDDLYDAFMIKYGILNQSAEREIYPLAVEHNVGVFVMASVRTSLRNPAEAVACLNQFIDRGLLPVPRPTLDDPLGLAAVSRPVPSLTRAAYQFAAAHPAVSTVLVGTGNQAHLRANVADITAEPLGAPHMDYLRRTYGGLAWTA